MKVSVDEKQCQGHGLCFMTAPEVFGLRDEDGHSYVLPDGNAPEHEVAAKAGAAACPERAISVD
ncbi:putative ferredoxin [Gordonia rhizosphera NBRC 16068]|uniref:Putative ferredoxin n=1 Tax=Gordonia rhizosphera NBRC 16068 TaxID=1108045 RepID=K6W7W0_9ACTN|nr:putative ferredoxin [Gordonia rhizosphera NBRC 16068]